MVICSSGCGREQLDPRRSSLGELTCMGILALFERGVADDIHDFVFPVTHHHRV